MSINNNKVKFPPVLGAAPKSTAKTDPKGYFLASNNRQTALLNHSAAARYASMGGSSGSNKDTMLALKTSTQYSSEERPSSSLATRLLPIGDQGLSTHGPSRLVPAKLEMADSISSYMDQDDLDSWTSGSRVKPVDFSPKPENRVAPYKGLVYHGGLFNPKQGILPHANVMTEFMKSHPEGRINDKDIDQMISARVTGKTFESPTISCSMEPNAGFRFGPRVAARDSASPQVVNYITSLYQQKPVGTTTTSTLCFENKKDGKPVFLDLKVSTGVRSSHTLAHMSQVAGDSIAQTVLGPKVGVAACCEGTSGYAVDYNDSNVNNVGNHGETISYREEREVVVPGGVSADKIKAAVLVFGGYMDKAPESGMPSNNTVIHRPDAKTPREFADAINRQVDKTVAHLKSDRYGKLEGWKTATKDLTDARKIKSTLNSIASLVNTNELTVTVTEGEGEQDLVQIRGMKDVYGIDKWVGVSCFVDKGTFKSSGTYTLSCPQEDQDENKANLDSMVKTLTGSGVLSTLETSAKEVMDTFINDVDQPHGLAGKVPKAMPA